MIIHTHGKNKRGGKSKQYKRAHSEKSIPLLHLFPSLLVSFPRDNLIISFLDIFPKGLSHFYLKERQGARKEEREEKIHKNYNLFV